MLTMKPDMVYTFQNIDRVDKHAGCPLRVS